MRPNVNVTAMQRLVRLFFLVGVAIAAYIMLSLFDHPARADASTTIDQIAATDAVGSVENLTDDVRKAVPAPKVTAPRTQPQKIKTPKIQTPSVRAPKVATPKIQAPKIQVPNVAVPKVKTPAVRTPKLPPRGSDVVRDAARVAVTRARTAIARLTSLPRPPAMPKLPRTPAPPWTTWTPPSMPALPWTPPLPQTSALRSMPAIDQSLTPLPQSPVLAQAPELCGMTMPLATFELPDSAGWSSVESNQAAAARPRTAPGTMPNPSPPRQPVDRSASTAQVRDSSGGNSPTKGILSSSWRPEATTAGCPVPNDLIARGRTVRYAGPPS